MATVPTFRQLTIKDNPKMFSFSDYISILKQIEGTHTPDGQDVEVRPILDIVDDVFRCIALRIDGLINGTHDHNMYYPEDKISETFIEGNGMFGALAYIIQKVLCETSCKQSRAGDADASAISILEMLSNYAWDAKVVITLVALAITYVEFCLEVELHVTQPLPKSVAVLKQLPAEGIIELLNALTSQFDGLNNLIKAMLDVTKILVEFRQLPHQYISPEQPPLSVAMTHIPTAAYWTIRSVVTCAQQISRLRGMSYEYITSTTTEAWELSSLAHKERFIHDHLMQLLSTCYQHMDEKMQIEAYLNLVSLFDKHYLDNTRILRHLIYLKDDILPLLEGSTKSQVHVEALRRKTVLLLISDLDISHEELMILHIIYRESRSRPEFQYEIVWIPMVDKSSPWTEAQQQRFEQLQSMMPWYTLYHPKLLEPAAVRYIKEVWRFAKKMIVVVLDPQGKVASPNALHMIWIWGNLAFPFTAMKEEALWREGVWRMELLVDAIDDNILEWIAQGKHICVYGGEDIEWIRKFTSTAKQVARIAGIELELVYAGKSNAEERVRKITAVINNENLSHFWPDITSVWYFWTRLEYMLYSKMQQGKNVESDHIMQEVMTVLSFDGSDQEWAIICLGSTEMARAKGDMILESLGRFEEWEENAMLEGFVPALREHLQQLHTPHHCNRLILPGIEGGLLPERILCPECGRQMDKYLMYRCYT